MHKHKWFNSAFAQSDAAQQTRTAETTKQQCKPRLIPLPR